MTGLPLTAYTLAVEEAGLKVTVDAGTPLSPALMLDVLRQVFTLPAAMASVVLWDLRAAKADPQLDDEAMRQIAAYLRDRQSERPAGLRMAFVVDRGRSLDLARRVAFLTENLTSPATVINTEADAWRWLNEDKEDP